MMTTPNKVQEIREAQSKSRERLAADAGVSFEYIRKIEAQQIPRPSLIVARRVAEALGLTVDEVFPPETVSDPTPAEAGKA